MSDMQHDEVYKELLKGLVAYGNRLTKLYKNDDNYAMEYQTALIELYPVLENVGRELNTYFGAKISFDEPEINSEVDKADNILPLLNALGEGMRNNPNFSNIRIAFDYRSSDLPYKLDYIYSHINSYDDEIQKDKSVYWLYNNLMLASKCLIPIYGKIEDKMWENIAASDIGDTMASKHKKYQAAEQNGVGFSDVIMSCVHSVGVDYLENLSAGKDFNITQEMLKDLKVNYKIDISDADFQQALQSREPVIKEIFDRYEEQYREVAKMGNAMEALDEKIWDYDDGDIAALIDRDAPEDDMHKDSLFVMTQTDVNQLLTDYPDYHRVQDDVKKEFAEYQEQAPAMEKYATAVITDEKLKAMFLLKLKAWMVVSSKTIQKSVAPLADLGAGRQPFQDTKEYHHFVDDVLEQALDVALISAGVFEYIPSQNKYGEKISIVLNSSNIGEDYILKLIDNKDKLNNKDFQSLAVLFNSFEKNYNYYRPILGFNREQSEQLKAFDLTEYVERLAQSPDSYEKLNISYLSARSFANDVKLCTAELHEVLTEFTKSITPMHRAEREVLEDYLKTGKEHNPKLDVARSLALADEIVNSLVLMPIYEWQSFSQENYLEGMDYVIDECGIDKSTKPFVKTAINGYKKMAEKKHLAISAEGKHSYLHYMAQNYAKLTDNLLEINEHGEYMAAIQIEQQGVYDSWLQHDTYKSNEHPSRNQLNAFLLNAKVNTKSK